jgi:prepilin-type N-terminal cleavage/methylation domain-containing protein
MKVCRCLLKRFSDRGGQKGFTLIEVLIAMGIFSFGIMMVTAMAVRGFNSYAVARTTTDEVYQNVTTIDTFRFALYSNAQIFSTNTDTPANYPFGAGNANFRCWDFNDLIVRDVKFIAVENQQLRSPSNSGFYRLFYTKSGKQQVN